MWYHRKAVMSKYGIFFCFLSPRANLELVRSTRLTLRRTSKKMELPQHYDRQAHCDVCRAEAKDAMKRQRVRVHLVFHSPL